MKQFLDNPTSDQVEYRFMSLETACEPLDLWQLRDDFLGWRLEDWSGFFAMAGGWQGCFRISQRDFGEWQGLLRAALLCPAQEWKSLSQRFNSKKVAKLIGPMRFVFDWHGVVPRAKAILPDSLSAIIATLQIDALNGAKFRICARHDCKSAPFKVEARHKIYCSSECAHLVAVRNSRERDAKETRTLQVKRRKDAKTYGTQKTR